MKNTARSSAPSASRTICTRRSSCATPRLKARSSQTVRADGVTTRFDRQTGAFIAYNPNGVIRTFFKPNDGERYYRRQAERGE